MNARRTPRYVTVAPGPAPAATKDADYKADTLVHELTHQMMHFWLPYLPNWVVEGTAEYTENLPLNAGRSSPSGISAGP